MVREYFIDLPVIKRSEFMLMRNKVTFVGLLMAYALTATRADGGVITLFTTNPTTLAGGTGSFDILLRNDMGTDVSISSFNTIMEVAVNSGITFTSVDDQISSPNTYIFSAVQNAPLGDVSNPPEVALSDFVNSSAVTVNDGSVFGLGTVYYTVDPTTAAGPVAVSFKMTGTTTYASNVYDGATVDLPLSFTGGTITVTSGAAVPEPMTAVIASLFFGGAAARQWRKRRQPSVRLV